MPAPQVRGFAERLNQVAGVRLDVAAIRNSFFGGGINIAGLITASDILEQVRKQALGDALVLPTICLKDGSLFLDDVTVAELESQAGRPVLVSPPKPAALAATLGLLD
jgi:NifB/MoaA-like Fe-S oxidoreductase